MQTCLILIRASSKVQFLGIVLRKVFNNKNNLFYGIFHMGGGLPHLHNFLKQKPSGSGLWGKLKILFGSSSR